MDEFVLGIDVGSTAVKVIMLSDDGRIVDESNVPHDLLSLHPNWAEEDANVWWDNVVKGVSQIAARHPGKMQRIKAIGCSGMVPAIVLLDKYGKPVRKTIQQQDARAIEQIEKITARLDQKKLYARTGGYTNQQHILPRLLWVKENEPEVWEKVTCVMGSYDWIVYKLTGVKSLEMNWAV
ncbi:MAG TPA: carbohydrate kinase, partial [Sutterella sp.]|nr:carbohydrate kinase [Sutterella sp.]